MRAFLLFAVLLFCVSSFSQAPLIDYIRPLKYQKQDGQLMANGIIRLKGENSSVLVKMDEASVQYTATDSGLIVSLPLTGKPVKLRVEKNGSTLINQVFEPIIKDDWGYFGTGTIHIISSSHQDIAWMNTPDSCMEERIHKIILPAMDIMKDHPGFKFGMEQSLNLLELVNMDGKYKEAAIKSYQSGQFGWGATFNQPYEGMESGEQLVRQLYLGKKWMKTTFNGKIDAQTAFNVDVPGRTPQFPQILAKAGVKNLFISRFKEGFYNWYSADGSKIFTYSPGNYGWAVMFYKYFDEDAPAAMGKLFKVLGNWNDYYKSRNIPPHYAVVLSNDASGPVYYEKVVKEWNEIVRLSGLQIPSLAYSTVDQFLGTVNVPAAKFDSIAGERPDLWLYIHGPAHYEAIKAKRKSAAHLPAAELFATIDGIIKGDFSAYPKSVFDSAWYYGIYPDHGWGGKHGDITDSIFRFKLERSNLLAENILQQSINSIAGSVKTAFTKPLVVFNDLNWARNALVYYPLPGDKTPVIVKNTEGEIVLSQQVTIDQKAYLAVDAKQVPSIGYSTYAIEAGSAVKPGPDTQFANSCENNFYKIRFGAGGIESLFDKALGVELINATRFAAGDVLDLGYDGLDAGEFTIITPPNMINYDKLSNHHVNWKLVNHGELLSVYEAAYQMNQVDYIQRITVYHTIKKIDFDIDLLNWKGDKNRQLSFALPLLTPKATIDYDVPMGMARVNHSELQMRPQGWAWGGTYWQKPEEIHPREAQNFITASAEKFGVTLSSQIAVFDWIDPTRDAVSYPVLQYVMMTSQKSCHGEGPWYYQKGRHQFKFSLSSHQPGWENGYAFGMENNHPLYTVLAKKNNKGKLPQQNSFFSTTSPFALVTTIKKADDNNDLVLRMVNMKTAPLTVQFKSFVESKQIWLSDLIEENAQVIPGAGAILPVNLVGQSIQTFRMSSPIKKSK
jgi:alpha-mannosidase